MERFLRRTVGAAALLGLTPVIAVSEAMAGTYVFDPTTDPCGQPNCSSEQVSGTVGELTGAQSTENLLPWTLQVFATRGLCLRLEVLSQDQDLIMNVVEPDGSTFFDDDGAGDLRPLVKIANTSDRGWNTVQISRFAGEFPDTSGSNFRLAYGTYPAGNANCANPTQDLAEDLVPLRRAARGGKPEVDPFDMGVGDFDPEAP